MVVRGVVIDETWLLHTRCNDNHVEYDSKSLHLHFSSKPSRGQQHCLPLVSDPLKSESFGHAYNGNCMLQAL